MEKNVWFWVILNVFDVVFEKFKLLCSCGYGYMFVKYGVIYGVIFFS